MALKTQPTLQVFLHMRSALLESGVRCKYADIAAEQTVKLYKRCVKRGCADPIAFVTSARRVEHYKQIYGVV